MGASGYLRQDQIADIMAYLFDPASPVNKCRQILIRL